MPQASSFKNQISKINKQVVSKMAELQKKQKAIVQVLNKRNEKKEIDKIKEKIKAIN